MPPSGSFKGQKGTPPSGSFKGKKGNYIKKVENIRDNEERAEVTENIWTNMINDYSLLTFSKMF